jgi:hypothetical protein
LSSSAFTLHPFAPQQLSPALQTLQITGQAERQQDLLTLQFRLIGEMGAIVWAPLHPNPTRQDGLWQHTCFEFFLGLPGRPDYWEVNLSPSGHWNIYRFSDYRQGMAPELAYAALPFQRETTPGQMTLQTQLDLAPLDLGKILLAKQSWELAVTMVIVDSAGAESYWALTHPGPTADFHARDGFMIKI